MALRAFRLPVSKLFTTLTIKGNLKNRGYKSPFKYTEKVRDTESDDLAQGWFIFIFKLCLISSSITPTKNHAVLRDRYLLWCWGSTALAFENTQKPQRGFTDGYGNRGTERRGERRLNGRYKIKKTRAESKLFTPRSCLFYSCCLSSLHEERGREQDRSSQ